MMTQELLQRGTPDTSLLEQAPWPVLIHVERKIVFVNEAGLDMIEFTRGDEVLGRSIFDFIRPEYHGAVTGRLDQHTRGLALLNVTKEKLVTLRNRTIMVECTSSRVRFGEEDAVMVIGREIPPAGASGAKERKQAALTVCAWCRNVHDPERGWISMEHYLSERLGIRSTHGICADCARRLSGTDRGH